ncbi:hypothetical protein ANCDUO_07526 [Ancylostoma duodenale]|uniref:Uncharacterized protein n=1 Tax=Ancylostoma duodenale TaxID=51022 RepID=A0A0C2GYH6_9BILA|nr:hypothetical protein ANCDUO_07526 [Ancylostoma duodenale]
MGQLFLSTEVFCSAKPAHERNEFAIAKEVVGIVQKGKHSSLEKECGIPYNRLRMFLTTKDGWVEEFRYPGMSLHSYRIEDGDVLNLQVRLCRCPITLSGPYANIRALFSVVYVGPILEKQ